MKLLIKLIVSFSLSRYEKCPALLNNIIVDFFNGDSIETMDSIWIEQGSWLYCCLRP